MTGNLRIVREKILGRAFPRLPMDVPTLSCPFPSSENGAIYYQSCQSEDIPDHSFAILAGDAVQAIVRCTGEAGRPLSCFGMPVEVWTPNAAAARSRPIARQVLGELSLLGRQASSVIIRTSPALDPDGIYAGRLYDLGAVPSITLNASIDLNASDAEIRADMRKGHRQQVVWGERNLSLSFVDAGNSDYALFDTYRQLHAEVAGRVTRPKASWDKMFQLIIEGNGDLILSSMDGQLLGGTLILDGGGVALYASGVYVREAFVHPLSHYPLFTAIKRARSRGCKRFDLGEVFGGLIDGANAKEVDIGRFKRGFSNTTRISTVWRHPTASEREASDLVTIDGASSADA